LTAFEVKASWQIPVGYKLEGKINVPPNSKRQAQLIVEDNPKEEIKMTMTQTWNLGLVLYILPLPLCSFHINVKN